jgi:hypothetical protein
MRLVPLRLLATFAHVFMLTRAQSYGRLWARLFLAPSSTSLVPSLPRR